jgi:hypothetical protein
LFPSAKAVKFDAAEASKARNATAWGNTPRQATSNLVERGKRLHNREGATVFPNAFLCVRTFILTGF